MFKYHACGRILQSSIPFPDLIQCSEQQSGASAPIKFVCSDSAEDADFRIPQGESEYDFHRLALNHLRSRFAYFDQELSRIVQELMDHDV